jgi:hypothetical protein
MSDRLTIAALQTVVGATADGQWGPASRAALLAKFTNRNAPAISDADFQDVANRWRVPVSYIKGVRKIETRRGAFDDQGRVSILYERHKFRNNTDPVGRFNGSNPALSGPPYGAGGYGPYSSQYEKLSAACALDPEAAFRACSWGAFQVLGENAVAIGYSSALAMALSLIENETAHLSMFTRFVETEKLVDKFRACRPNDPASCVPFVSAYNGAGYRDFKYHVKLAAAIA